MEAKEAISIILARCDHRLDELAELTFEHLLLQEDGTVTISAEAQASLDARYAEVMAEALSGPSGLTVGESVRTLSEVLALAAAVGSQPELFKRELVMAVMTRTQQGRNLFAMAVPAGTA